MSASPHVCAMTMSGSFFVHVCRCQRDNDIVVAPSSSALPEIVMATVLSIIIVIMRLAVIATFVIVAAVVVLSQLSARLSL